MSEDPYENYVELCEELKLSYSTTDLMVNKSSLKIMKVLLERIKKLEEDHDE